MEFLEDIRTFFFLKATNLTDESEKLARATVTLINKDMRDKVMKTFSDFQVLTRKDNVPKVKKERVVA